MSQKCTFLALTITIFSCCLSVTNAAIPDYIKVCKRNDPNISSCVKNSIVNLREKIANGIPELNVPGIEPLRLQKLYLQDNVNINLTDLVVHGPSNFDLIDITVDLDKNRFAYLYKFKELKFTGIYDIDMKILRIPLKSSGPISGTFKNLQMTGKMNGRKVVTNGQTHLMFRPIELTLHPGESKLHLENLFRSQPALQTATNDLINNNNEIFVKEILPVLEKTIADRFTILANRITAQFTYDELFPLN